MLSFTGCNDLAGTDEASDKFSGAGGQKQLSPNENPSGNQVPTTSSTPGCENGEKISLSGFPAEVQACVDQGYLYNFNRYVDNGNRHKSEYCVRDIDIVDCSAESLITLAQQTINKDKSADIERYYGPEGYLPISCAKKGNRLMFQLIRQADDGSCSARSGNCDNKD